MKDFLENKGINDNKSVGSSNLDEMIAKTEIISGTKNSLSDNLINKLNNGSLEE